MKKCRHHITCIQIQAMGHLAHKYSTTDAINLWSSRGTPPFDRWGDSQYESVHLVDGHYPTTVLTRWIQFTEKGKSIEAVKRRKHTHKKAMIYFTLTTRNEMDLALRTIGTTNRECLGNKTQLSQPLFQNPCVLGGRLVTGLIEGIITGAEMPTDLSQGERHGSGIELLFQERRGGHGAPFANE